jgi:muconolactone delta-isomerase
VQTLSYGDQRITYTVNISKPVLMVENELSVDGWRANTSKVQLVNAGIPLRAWRLAPGHYKFVAFFQEPDRTLQELAAVLALIAWLGCVLLIRRSNRSVSRQSLPSV